MSGVLHFLLIDDNPDDRVLVRRELLREFPDAQVKEATDAESLARALQEDSLDLIITDYQLGWSDGLTIVNAVKARCPDCAVIMFTASGDQEVAVKAMKRGLDDYIIKSPRHYVRLRAAARLALDRAATRRRAAHLEDRLQALLDRLEVGIFRATTDGRLQEANAALLRLLGATSLEELQAQDEGRRLVSELLGTTHIPPEEPREAPGREIPLRRPDDSLIWVSVSVTTGRGADGGSVIDGLVEDITGRKRAEAEQDQLLEAEQAARREAEQAGRAKDRFLAMLSHELRTPLTPVLATVTALIDEPGTPAEFRSILEMIRRSVELEARLIDDLLDVAQVVNGKLRLDRSVVDAHALVHQTLGILRSDLYGKRMHLTLELRATSHHVLADPARFQQVLWNLIKNAVKFTPEEGSITIRSRNESEPGAGELLVMDVVDAGIGIDPSLLPRIFEAFEQGEDATTRRYGGLGLGLAISRSVAEAHGARLTAASAGCGRGAIFSLTFPTTGAPREAAAPLSPSSGSGAASRSLRILLVEDDPPSLRVMSRLLQQRGHVVTTADRVASALEFADEDFDLVISDIGLPDGTGLDLMRQLQARRLVPGIALSGFGMDEDLRKSREAGFGAHLTKPVNFRNLEAAIRQVTSAEPRPDPGP